MFKSKKIIYYILVFFVLVLFILFLVANNKSKVESKVLCIDKNYDLSSLITEEEYLLVNIYVSNRKSYIIDKNQLKSCSLIDDNKSLIELDLLDIIECSNHFEYDGDIYYQYVFKFDFKIVIEDECEWYLKNAFLNLSYNGNKEYCFKIGSVSIIKYKPNDDMLSITHIKPLLYRMKKNDYLAGIVIGIRNNNKNKIIINKIEVLNSGIAIGNEIVKINEVPENNDFKSVSGYEFNDMVEGNTQVNYYVDSEENIILLIPIYYNKLLSINSFPLKIHYYINGEQRYHMLSDYIFFEPNSQLFYKDTIHIYNIL